MPQPRRRESKRPDRFVNFAVGLALHLAHPRPRLSAFEETRRFALEKALQQRRFCDAFALWRSCRNRLCRRRRRCCGDADHCLRQGLRSVPRALQQRVKQRILDATPQNCGAPERDVRQRMPVDLYDKPRWQAR